MPQLRINTDAVVAFTNKLEKLPRTAFPVAVRAALNAAAFDMKKNTIQSSASATFTIRKSTFFKANSRVQMASGFDINNMFSAVGFTGKDQAIDDLEKQEHGGTIGRPFIPSDQSRVSKSRLKNIKPNARKEEIKLIKAKDAPGKSAKQRFVQSVYHAGVGGSVLSEPYKGFEYVWKVNSLNRNNEGGFKLTMLHQHKKENKIKVEATHFMSKATEMTSKKMDDFYIKAAEFQFKKALQ